MTQEEINELADLKKAILGKNGKPKKTADKALVERLNQLQEMADDPAEFPDDARIENNDMAGHVLNVLGRRVGVNGPKNPRP